MGARTRREPTFVDRTTDAPTRPRIRLGLVSFLNSAPIGYGLLHGRQRQLADVTEAVPSELAENLARGALDLALIPSVEYARAVLDGRDIAIVPRIAIAAQGEAESVLFFHHPPLEEVRSVALDTSSRTSAMLLRLLLRRLLCTGRPEPKYLDSGPDLPAMLRAADGALLIGDRALFAASEHPALVADLDVHDLGQEWRTLTGLPFVFAFWAGPIRADSPALVEGLLDSLEEGLAHAREIAHAEAPKDPDRAARILAYLTRAMDYALGPEEIEGLRTFYTLLAEEGLLPGPVPALRFHPSR